jgi:hypothetical protein
MDLVEGMLENQSKKRVAKEISSSATPITSRYCPVGVLVVIEKRDVPG